MQFILNVKYYRETKIMKNYHLKYSTLWPTKTEQVFSFENNKVYLTG